MLEIVAVPPGDEPALASFRSLLAEYEAELPPDLRIPDLETELQTLPERYPAPEAALLLAREGPAAVGCVVVRPLDAATAEIKRLYVAPIGRRAGAGRALIVAAIAFAGKRGHARVVLDTERRRLAAAYELYRSLGFTICAPYGPADYADPTFMELQIGTMTRSRADA